MKLTEFNSKPQQLAKKALKENFNTDFNFEKLSLSDTRNMLSKVKGLLKETRQTPKLYSSENDPSYLKLVFMEQALTHHYGELKALPMYNTRVVLENEEVEKSQVILAAQDMVDTIQKMIEDISDMLVKELPAVVDSVNSEVGTDQGEQFNSQASEALRGLSEALTNAKTGLQSALGVVTGQGGGGFGDEMGGELGGMGDEGTGADMGGELGDMGGEELGGEEGMEELPAEEPEELPSVGRAKR